MTPLQEKPISDSTAVDILQLPNLISQVDKIQTDTKTITIQIPRNFIRTLVIQRLLRGPITMVK